MPHITLHGYNNTTNITSIDIHVKVEFSRKYWNDQNRSKQKLQELQEKLEAVIVEYFPDYSVDRFTNHEWNTKMFTS